MKIDSAAIRELAGLLEETGLTEIEVSEGDQMIRINKGGAIIGAPAVSAVAMHSDPTVRQQANLNVPDPAPAAHPGAVASPMVGTVYLQSEPGSPSFVHKGKSVKAGDTLVIIEAMKVMNPIKAEKAGIVTSLLVENGQPVEYGDVLMVIE